MTDTEIVTQTVGFFQLAKYNAATGEFEGVMASERPDRVKESLNYELSKPFFKRWSEGFRARSGGKSLGNVREMHGLSAVGKLTVMTFDDKTRRILVRGKVIDPLAKTKCEEGVYTGLSIGGKYIGEPTPDSADPKILRYVAEPSEVSLVDDPCNPDATFSLVGGDGSVTKMHFAPQSITAEPDEGDEGDILGKATKRVDGKDLPKSAFAYAPTDSPSDWKFPVHDEAHARAAVQMYAKAKGIPDAAKDGVKKRILAAAKRFGIEVGDDASVAKGELSLQKAVSLLEESSAPKRSGNAWTTLAKAAAAA